MSLGAVVNLIENSAKFVVNPGVGTGFALSKSLIGLIQDSFTEDINTTLKKDIADSELETAKNVLASIHLEAEANMKNGINRIVAHLESAFNLYIKAGEFESSCVCALYISLMHKAIGNTNEELHKRIWLRVPLISREAIHFGDYGSYVKRLFSEDVYNAVLRERSEERIRIIDLKIKALEAARTRLPMFSRNVIGGIMSSARIAMGYAIMELKDEKRLIQGEGEQKHSILEKLRYMYLE